MRHGTKIGMGTKKMSPQLSDNFTWNYIDVPESVVNQLQLVYSQDASLQWITKKALKGHYQTFVKLDHVYIQESIPLLKKWLQTNQITPIFMAFFVSKPLDDPDYIHIDIDEAMLSINFPVINCNNTTTFFYHRPDDMIVEEVDVGAGHIYHKCVTQKEFQVRTTYELTSPIIMRNDIPHRFINPNPTVRVCLTIRCDPSTKLPLHLIKS